MVVRKESWGSWRAESLAGFLQDCYVPEEGHVVSAKDLLEHVLAQLPPNSGGPVSQHILHGLTPAALGLAMKRALKQLGWEGVVTASKTRNGRTVYRGLRRRAWSEGPAWSKGRAS